jgi:ABC-type polysaccharide/polyol phosphate transport system ATPase subunit
MNSISSFNNAIVKIENLTVSFNIDYHHEVTLRDQFIKFLSNPLKTFRGTSKRRDILKDINLTLNNGEKLGILGVNGAGKTTLCRAIVGMYKGKSGEVKVTGETRIIFDTTLGIVPELTGRENAELVVKFLYPKCSPEEQKKIVEESLEFSELGEFVDVSHNKYSKGMQTRLCLSLISARPCELLILDEVFDGADEFFQKKIANRILEMIEKSGAVIFVSHSPEQIMKACNRCIVIDDHRIAFDGGVQEAINYYRNLKQV